MIRTVADLIEKLKEEETRVLKNEPKFAHGPTIGTMYEGLTREILARSVFNDLDIRVVEGHIAKDENDNSDQLDCMVVIGDPSHKMRFTEHYVYEPDKVIAVVEVKKNLFGSDLDDSFENLNSVVQSGRLLSAPHKRVKHGYKNLFNFPPPETQEEVKALSQENKFVFDNLVRDSALPVRIVMGYEGYAHEHGLRMGLMKNLQERVNDQTRLLLPNGFPNLILCRNSALIKLNGLPYSPPPYDEKRGWLFYASTSGYNAVLLLELLWTRIASIFNLNPVIFGDDLDQEPMHPLLWARGEVNDDRVVCFYREHSITKQQLDAAPNQGKKWEPVSIPDDCAPVFFMMQESSEVPLDLISDGETMGKQDIVDFLVNTKLMYLDSGKLKYLTESCAIVAVPELGGWVAGENTSGRLNNWIKEKVRLKTGQEPSWLVFSGTGTTSEGQ